MNTSTYTFWQLIQAYAIEIPIIQRDYAQGRPSASEIRNEFLDAIYTHLINQDPLDIDFVYGSISGSKFIPLDGQQRLTTLFLLHWYLANKEQAQGSFAAAVSKRFLYETRTASRMFCEALTEHAVHIATLDGTVSSYIKNQSWFYASWERDPTILAMLVMLDAIHSRFLDLPPVYEQLISSIKPLITFQFIELKEYGLTDKLYIKMNSRGKPLTRFENFKAQLELTLTGLQQQGEPVDQKVFADKMDGTWTDLFWNYKNSETKTFDDEFLNFFRTTAICTTALDAGKAEFDQHIDLLRDREQSISFNKLVEMGCITTSYISYVSQVLDQLSHGARPVRRYLSQTNLINEEALFKNAIRQNLDYGGLVTFYAFTRYITTYQPDVQDDPQLLAWLRVVRNLVEGSRLTYFNTAREFSSALNTIDNLLPKAENILVHLADLEQKPGGFVGLQIDEEILKAHLLLKTPEWTSEILPMEDHGYFNGQIGFLLNFAGIEHYFKEHQTVNWDENTGATYLERLKFYYQQAAGVFNQDGLKIIENHRWERALLATGNYLLSQGHNESFLINSDRDISWKRLLRDNSENRGYVKTLLEKIDVNALDDSLKVIIDQFDDMDDWRYYFINRPKTIAVCGHKKFIRFHHDCDILLLGSGKTSGYHCELYSYALMRRLEKAGNKCEYAAQRSYWETKMIWQINKRNVKIYFKAINDDDWRYHVKLRGLPMAFFETEDEVVDYLAAENYIKVPVQVENV